MLLADFQPYVAAQDAAEQAFRDVDRWTRMSILNVARCGYFSSDRSIREYCDEIWKISPIEIAVRTEDEGEATARLGRPAEAEAASLPSFTPEQADQLRDLPLLVGLDVLHASRAASRGIPIVPEVVTTPRGTPIAADASRTAGGTEPTASDLLQTTRGAAQATLIALATAVAAPTATARFLIRGPLVQSLVCSEIEMIERSERVVESLAQQYDLASRDDRARLHDDVLKQCRA